MLERDAKRRYFWELGLGFAFYIAVLWVCAQVSKQFDAGLAQTLIALVTAIPVFLLVWVIARQFQRSDEFVRLRSLESIAVAAGVTAGLTFTYGFLEQAGFPRLSMFWVWGVMGFTWAMHSILWQRCFNK
jgi:hypothetical protein